MSALMVETPPPLAFSPAEPALLVRAARAASRGLRLATPETAALLRAAGRLDKTVLPRWQPYGEGIHQWATPGAYTAGIHYERGTPVRVKGRNGWGWVTPRVATKRGPHIAWTSKAQWLTAVEAALDARGPEVLCVRTVGGTVAKVARATFLAYSAQLADHAHQPTGRRIIVRPMTLAQELQVHVKTVRRCQRILEDMGFYVVLTPGRMLTLDEKCAAYEKGSYQRGMANEAALVVPREFSTTPAPPRSPRTLNVPPTSGRYMRLKKLTVVSSLGVVRGMKEPPPAAPHQERGRHPNRVYDPAALDLARNLVLMLPWLTATPPGRLEPALRRFARSPLPWTARDVVDAIDQTNARMGRASMTRELVKQPVGLLNNYLRHFDPQADHPNPHLALRPNRPGYVSDRTHKTTQTLHTMRATRGDQSQ